MPVEDLRTANRRVRNMAWQRNWPVFILALDSWAAGIYAVCPQPGTGLRPCEFMDLEPAIADAVALRAEILQTRAATAVTVGTDSKTTPPRP